MTRTLENLFIALRTSRSRLPVHGLVEDRAQDKHDEVDHEGYGGAVSEIPVLEVDAVGVDRQQFR